MKPTILAAIEWNFKLNLQKKFERIELEIRDSRPIKWLEQFWGGNYAES
jgi:hypothetical protein